MTTKQARHTPVPWEWKSTDDPMDLAILIGKDGSEIMNFGNGEQYYPSQGTEPNEANARLIAAAPELLEALKGLLQHQPKDSASEYIKPNLFKWIRKAKQVIAKVEGETR